MNANRSAGPNSKGRIKTLWKKYRRSAVLALALVVVTPAALAAFIWMPPSMPDLSKSDISEKQFLYESWTSGDAIVVVRHLERCDRAEVPCLVAEDGLTARSVVVAAELAEDFSRLGLDQADIYNSPLTRTGQTADLLFSTRSVDKGWLYDCRKQDTLLRDALNHKQPGRNLVLVTHSSCISHFEDNFGFSSDTPEYGTAIFISVEPRHEDVRLLGFVDVDDWDKVFHSW